jgi:putative endonuclease
MASTFDSIIRWRGVSVPRFQHHDHYVYLIHFSSPLGNQAKPRGMATHYMGSTSLLDERLSRHAHGNGSAIMAAVHQRGIKWQLVRLWPCESKEAALALEYRLKRAGHGPRYCYLCNKRLQVDDLVYMRQGHQRLAWRNQQGRRRPMQGGML